MKIKATRNQISAFAIVFFVFFILIWFGAFGNVRAGISDNLFSSKGMALENIVIIAIDDRSIQEIGRWPWDRDEYVPLLQKLDGAKVVGMDLSFFEESDSDDGFRKELANMDNVVLAAEINGGVLYTPIFNSDYGYVNVLADVDGDVRSVDFSLFEGVKLFSVEILENSIDREVEMEGINVINFVGGPESFTTLSVIDVLNGDFDFTDKYVLIGATAPNLHDNYFVPTSNGRAMAGVEVHANVLQNLILDNFVKTQGTWSVLFLVFIFGAAGLFFVSRLRILYSILIVLGAVVLYGFVSVWIFEKYDYIMDLFYLPLSILIFSGVGQGVNYVEEQKKRKFLKNAFGKYISKDLLKQIEDRRAELKLGGGKREITVFFSDIRGFTTISEGLSPEELVHFVNLYLTAMTKIILDYGGTVDKYIGDAIMAFWNAPLKQEDHARIACECALAQIRSLSKLREEWKKEGYPAIHIGCGLHTGDAIIGNMGSEDRFDYTAMGDTINLGARLESITKQYGCQIIVSSATYDKVKDSKKIKFRKLDKVTVKGKKVPVTIYEMCVDFDSNFVSAYEEAFKFYLDRDFVKALKGFQKALDMKKDDKSCELFVGRCKNYIRKGPGKDWDGAFVMKTK
jgi:adenylate cyclase